MCQQRDMSKFACSCKKFVKNWRNRKFANIGFLFRNMLKIANFAAVRNLERRVKYRAELDLIYYPKKVPLVQYITIQWIIISKETYCTIHKTVIYPVDSAIQPLNNRSRPDKYLSSR